MDPEPTVTVIQHGGAVVSKAVRLAVVALAVLAAVAVLVVAGIGSGSHRDRAPIARQPAAAATAAPVVVATPGDMKNDRDGPGLRDADDH